MRGFKFAAFFVLSLLSSLTFSSSSSSQGISNAASPTILPVTGIPVPELAAYDQVMQQYMEDRSIKAGALAVMKDGLIVFELGYGWRDQAGQIPLVYNDLFRWASIIKPVTAASIKKLADAGQLNTSDKVFCLPDSVGTCHLNITPFGVPDVRLIGSAESRALEMARPGCSLAAWMALGPCLTNAPMG